MNFDNLISSRTIADLVMKNRGVTTSHDLTLRVLVRAKIKPKFTMTSEKGSVTLFFEKTSQIQNLIINFESFLLSRRDKPKALNEVFKPEQSDKSVAQEVTSIEHQKQKSGLVFLNDLKNHNEERIERLKSDAFKKAQKSKIFNDKTLMKNGKTTVLYVGELTVPIARAFKVTEEKTNLMFIHMSIHRFASDPKFMKMYNTIIVGNFGPGFVDGFKPFYDMLSADNDVTWRKVSGINAVYDAISNILEWQSKMTSEDLVREQSFIDSLG